MQPGSPVLVGVDAGASKAVAIAVTSDGTRLRRGQAGGANPKRHGLDVAADRIATLTREVACATDPDLLFVAGAGIDRPEHARRLEAALRDRFPVTRVIVVNDTLAVLRAATPDGVGLAIPVSTGGNVLGRGPDGRVTDRGHGIFGGSFVLGALAVRAAWREPSRVDPELRATIDAAGIAWLTARRPAPEVARLGPAVVRAAQAGDPYPTRMVDRWCRRVTGAVAEEVERLALGPEPAIVVYGGLLEASPWLGDRIRAAVREAAPQARFVVLSGEPAEGAALLARDAWHGASVAWDFSPRR